MVSHLFVAPLAVVRVAAVQELALDVLVQRVSQVAVVLDVHADHAEGLLAGVAVGASFADLLIGKDAAENLSHLLFVSQGLERFVRQIDEAHEEFERRPAARGD